MLKPFAQSHRSLWDVIGERREQEQRLAPAPRPIAHYDTARIGLADAWLWLPNLTPAEAKAGKALGKVDADFEHDPRLVSPAGHRRNVRRIRAGTDRAEIRALPRALQLLQAMLRQWHDFAAELDWDQVQVVLFAPTDIAPDPWLDAALEVWPFDYLPGHGFIAPEQTFSTWLPWALQNDLEAHNLLCIGLDSWATVARAGSFVGERMAGEAIAVLHLQRIDLANADGNARWHLSPAVAQAHEPRALQSRKSSGGIEQLAETLCERSGMTLAEVKAVVTEGHHDDNRLEHLYQFLNTRLPDCDLQQHVIGHALLAGEYGHGISEMSALGLALQAAKSLEGAVLVFDRHASTQTQGWLLGPSQVAVAGQQTSVHA
ncbi:hypothetical protein [Pseudomonas putida]|uniref:hypothetical protein n=1 Tax=Pseudomonas putida TaxID=303 RepID=UPI0020C3472A|nr:hypothetical protein [Pseudomonas putida]UTL83512.1 hypothetical protein NL778_12110 [Pseudomonas putida]